MPRGIPIPVSEEDLREAVENVDSWRGVLRRLGYSTTNGRTAAMLRERARSLGYDTSHFRRATRWTDDQLRQAIERSRSWGQVLEGLSLTQSGAASIAVKARAAYLGLDYSHIENRRRVPRGEVPLLGESRIELLRSAAPSLAAAWFIQHGCRVSWPLEPCPYDLVVDISRVLYRIQVKTATYRDHGADVWACGLAQNGNGKGTPYDPDDIDFFFIVDGDGGYYLVPIQEVAGQRSVNLNTLEHRRVL